MRLMPRFCLIHVSTQDPTSDQDEDYTGKAVVISWGRFTIELQFAWRTA